MHHQGNMSAEMKSRWNIDDFGWMKESNESYNKRWISKYGLDENIKELDQLEGEGLDISDSEHHQIGWLRNIDRLMDMLPIELPPSSCRLIDVGCGSGVSTLYLADNYAFSSLTGIDFSDSLIRTAKKNQKRLADFNSSLKPISFEKSDAREYLLPHHKHLVYMFNPFGFQTAEKFISNNLEVFRETSSILAIAWDTWIAELSQKRLHKSILRNGFYKLSLVFF